jgi:hypothetical protein
MTIKPDDISPEAFAKRHDRAAAAFFEMEAEICDLARTADFATHDEFGVNA